MESTNVLTTTEPPIGYLTLNNPRRRNALSLGLIDEAIAALLTLADDRHVRVIIIRANGPVFSSGHDLSEMIGREESEIGHLFAQCRALMTAIHDVPKPVIAEVAGVATAAGCQLVAACDLAVAAEEAMFATPGVRIGLFCTTPMVEVARSIGRKRAMEMLLTGTPITAQVAAEWGLVNRVVTAGQLPEETRALAMSIATASAETVATGKQAFWSEIDLGRHAAYDHASSVMIANAMNHDAQEGMTAFLEKRAPVWK